MILKDITNRQQPISIKDLSKPPLPEMKDNQSLSFYCGLFQQITQYSESMAIQSLRFSFSGPLDPMFLARCKQIEWIFSTRTLLQLNQDTIFHAVAYFDKFISLKNPPLSKYQLIAAACIAMASKVNQIYPVYFSNIVSMLRLPVKSQNYSEMQSEILYAFNFQLPSTTLYELFFIYLTKYNLPKTILKKQSIISILQNILLDYELMTYNIKLCAISAISLSAKMKRLPLILEHRIIEKKQYRCTLERLTEIIAKLRAKFSQKYKINNPENSNKNIEL